jgi:hypothetical protein
MKSTKIQKYVLENPKNLKRLNSTKIFKSELKIRKSVSQGEISFKRSQKYLLKIKFHQIIKSVDEEETFQVSLLLK